PIPHLVLEKIIFEDLNTILQSIDNMREVIEQNQAALVAGKRINDNEKTRLAAELEKVRKLKKAVYEDYRSELISKDEFVTYRQDYLKKEALLEKQLEHIDQRQEKDVPDIFESPWVKRLLELRAIEKLDRDMIVEMIHAIKVYENHKIKITYNFSCELEALFKTVYTDKENIG
ncbi:MAG: resolvase, partial [Lachnospiraceae bacterium]|nr:resolvase [Lachnospiraceae bacterium]